MNCVYAGSQLVVHSYVMTAVLPEWKHELSEAHGCSQLQVLCRGASLTTAAIALGLVAACYLDFTV